MADQLVRGLRLAQGRSGAERGVSNAAGHKFHGLWYTNPPRLGAHHGRSASVPFHQLVIDRQVRRRVRFRLADLRRLRHAALHVVTNCGRSIERARRFIA